MKKVVCYQYYRDVEIYHTRQYQLISGHITINLTEKARQKYGSQREFSAILNDVVDCDYKSVWMLTSGKIFLLCGYSADLYYITLLHFIWKLYSKISRKCEFCK